MKNLIHRILLVSALLGAGFSTTALAKEGQPLFFMKATDIKGNSVVVGHEGEIDLHSISYGLSNSGSMHVGGGGGAGKVSFSDLSLMKRLDSATGSLFLNCATGKHIPEVIITARFSDGKMEDYLIIKMKEVIVTSFRHTSASTDGVFEEVSLNFARIELSVRTRDAKGNLGPWEKTSWNIATSSEK